MNSWKKSILGVSIVLILGLFGGAGAIAQEKLILTVWDQFGTGGFSAAGPAAEEIHKLFEKRYPEIKVVRSFFSTWAMRETLRAAMAAGDQPNIWYTFPASAYLDTRAKAGLLTDLTEAALQKGWFDMWPKALAQRCMLNGRLYGVPHEMDYMGIYFNKMIFAKLGLSVPTTFNEFLELCQKLKNQGIIPLAFGDGGTDPTGHSKHQMTLYANLYMTREEFEEAMFGEKKWTQTKLPEALRTFKEVVDRGFYNKGFSGIGYLDANSLFVQGKTAMELTGTWFLESFLESPLGKEGNLGMCLFPPMKEGNPYPLLIGEGSQYEVSSSISAKKKEAAIEYLDFIISDTAKPIWISKGSLFPVRKAGEIDWDKYDIPTTVKEFMKEAENFQEQALWDFYTSFTPQMDLIIAGKWPLVLEGEMSVQKFIEVWQATWDKEKIAGNVWSPGEIPIR